MEQELNGPFPESSKHTVRPTECRTGPSERRRRHLVGQAILLAMLVSLPPRAVAEGAQAPTFFAVSVGNLDASVKWYRETLDLTVDYLPGTATVKVALLQGKGLVVELIEDPQAFALRTRLPEVEKRYLVHGLFKVGFFVSDLEATVTRLKQRGAAFKGEMFTDLRLGARSILLLDNSGNVIQLFERLANK